MIWVQQKQKPIARKGSSQKEGGHTMKKKMRMPVALIMTLMMALTLAAPAFAASAPKVQDVDYDRQDKEVSIDFVGKVDWSGSPKVKITRDGKNYARYIIEKDRDDIEIKVNKLSYGKKYSYKVTGVRKAGTGEYKTIKGTFYATDD